MNKLFFLRIALCVCAIVIFSRPNLAAETPKGADQREAVIAYAKTFIGTPYLFGGTTKQGMDCSGFIFTVVKDSLKITIPRTTSQLYAFAEPISTAKLEPGDLVFFKTTSSGSVSHVGIYIGRSQFIHAASDGPNTGVIISSLNEAYWKRTYYSAGSFLPKYGSEKIANEKQTDRLPEDQIKADQNKTAQKKTAPRSEVLSGVSVETTLLFNWALFTSRGFYPNFRGVNFNAGFLFNNKFALNVGVRYDAALDSVMMPVTMQFLPGYGFRIYWGPSPNFKKDTAMPLVLGFSWQAKLYENRMLQLAFVQDFSYTVTDLVSPSTWFSDFPSKLCFSTGIRVSFPLDKR